MTTSVDLRLGARDGPSLVFDGIIAETLIFDRVLSSNEQYQFIYLTNKGTYGL